ncbi:MAG: PaaI family thioesterase [Thermodesulfobacteriota bacterium]
MGRSTTEEFFRQVEGEPYAQKLGLRLIAVEPGRAVVEMTPREDCGNILGMTHGGAVFSLVDEAFQVSCNSHGTVAVALNLTMTYHKPPRSGATLRAESREIHRSRKTGTYFIQVTDDQGNLIASCQALAYRKQAPLPFLSTKETAGD